MPKTLTNPDNKEGTNSDPKEGQFDDSYWENKFRSPAIDDSDKNISSSSSAQGDSSLAETETQQESANSNSLYSTDDSESQFIRSSMKEKSKFYFALIKKRKSLLFIFAIAVPTLAFVVGSLGPLKFLHMSEMLQDLSFSNQEISMSHRIRNLVVYSQLARGGDGKLENTRLGTIEAYRAGKIDKKLAKSGLKMEYSRPGGKFERITLNLDDMPDDLKQDLKGVKSDADRNAKIAKKFGVDIKSIERSGNVISIKAGGTFNNRTIIHKMLAISPDFDKRAAAWAARPLIKRSNATYNPNTKIREAVKSSAAETYKKFQDSRRARLASATKDVDLHGKSGSKLFKEIASKTVTSVGQIVTEAGTIIGAVVAVVQLSCTVRDSADQIANIQTLNKVMPMMNAANELISVASKMKAGDDIDSEFLNNYSKNFNSSDNGVDGNWNNATLIKYANSVSSGVPINDDYETEQTFQRYPELDPNNKKFIQKANNIIEFADTQYNQAMLSIPMFGQIIQAYNALPLDDIKPTDLSCGVVNLPGDILMKVVDTVGGYSPLYQIVKGKFEELGNAIIGWIAGSAIDLTEDKYAGAPYAEAVFLGGRYMANESSMSMGGQPLTDAQEVKQNEIVREYRAINDERNFIAKMFDIKDYRSPAAQVASSIYAQDSLETVAAIPQRTLSNINSVLFKKVNAAPPPSQVFYGVPMVGFDLDRLDKDAYENPYINAEYVYDNLSNDPDKKAHFEECTGIEITANYDFITHSYEDENNPTALYLQPDYESRCKDMDTDEVLFRTRLLAFDTLTLKSFSCLEFDDEESCKELLPYDTNNEDTGDGEEDSQDKFLWPLNSDIKINSCFNQPLSKGPHPGLDFYANMNTPVFAVASGEVVGQLGGSYGIVEIKHNDELYSVYEHLSSIDVRKGQKVDTGQKIGSSGQTGSPGAPHLHFGFTKDVSVFAYAQMGQGKIINPLRYLNDNQDYKQCSAKPEIQ